MSLFHLKAPKENTQLLADAFDFNVPMSVSNVTNNYKSFKNNQNISNNQATITMQPLLRYMEARLPIKLRLKVKAHRTITPTQASANPAIMGTAPSVLNIDTFTVTPGSVNNLVNKISLEGLEKYNYEQNDSVLRQIQTLINLMQYDQKKLNREYGLHVSKDIDNFVDFKTAIGTGNLTNASDVVQTVPFIQGMEMYGFKNMLYSHYKWLIDRNTKYCVLDKKEQNNIANYTDGDGAVIPGLAINANSGINGYGELMGVANAGDTIYQTAYIDIYEDLMAPFLSTCYADDYTMTKTIATNSKVECTFNFDSNYLKSIVKCASEITIDSVDIDSIEIHNIHLFSSQPYKKEIVNRASNNAQSLSYSYLPQIAPNVLPQNIKVFNSNTATATTTTVGFTQTSLNRIEKYYLLACPCDATKNNSNQRPSQLKNLLFADIDNVTLTVTAKGTTYPIMNYTRRELEEMTADVVGRIEWLEYISKDDYKTEYSINTLKSGPTTSYNAVYYSPAIQTFFETDGTGRTALRRQRLPLYIIDMSKLSLGEINGVPISPCVTYNDGITLEFGFQYTNGFDIVQEPQMMIGCNPNQTYQTIPLCLPISLQLGRINPSLNFELVPYSISADEYSNQYVKMLEDHTTTVRNNHSQFGAGFFSDLWSGIKSVANTVAPIAEAVVPMADKVFGGKNKSQKKIYKRMF